MRAKRGPLGLRGRAGVAPLAPLPVWPEGRGLLLARPLLWTSRSALRAQLAAGGRKWLEDPANDDPRFERIEVRRALVPQRFAAVDRAAFLERVDAARSQLTRRLAEAGALLREAVVWREAGAALLDAVAFAQAGPYAADEALRAVVAAAAGRAEPLGADQLARIRETLALNAATVGLKASAGGVLAARLSASQVLFARDPGAAFGRADGAGRATLKLAEGECGVWDGRFAVGPAPEAGEVSAKGPVHGPLRNLCERTGPIHVRADGSVNPIRACWLGPELAARAVFPYRRSAWADLAAAQAALGAGG